MVLVLRRTIWVIGGAIFLTLVALAILHSRPARARALAMIASRLDDAGVVARASRLDYNLLTRTVHLYDVTFATPTGTSQPFFSAKEIHATLGWDILFGRIDLNNVEVVRPQVVLLRNAAGGINWPTTAGQTTPSQSLRIEHARVSDLVVLWQDAQTASSVEAALSLELTSDGRNASGPVAVTGPSRVRWRDRETTVAALDGRLSWNDRDLSIRALTLRVPEGTLRADGRVDALLGNPRLDIQLVIDANLAAISPWTNLDRPMTGSTHADAHIVGPLTRPQATLALAGRDVALPPLPPIGVDAAVRFSGNTAELTSFRGQIANGWVTARGQASLDGHGDVRLDWQQVDLPAVLRTALGLTQGVVPAARVSGSLAARWTAPQLEQLELTAESRLVSTRDDRTRLPKASAPKRGGRVELPIDAAIKLDLRGRQWTVSADDVRVQGARATAALGGVLSARGLAQSPIRGSIHVLAEDAAGVSRALVQSGVIRKEPVIRGTGVGDFKVSGTLGAPTLDGTANATVEYESLPSATVHTRASVSINEVRLSEIDARLAGGSARGAMRWSSRSGRIDGSLNASMPVKDLVDLSAILPKRVPVDGSLDLSAALSGSLAQPRATVTGNARSLELAGQHVDRLTANVRVDGSEMAVDRLLLESGDGRLEAHGTVDLTRQTYAAHVLTHDVPIRPVLGIATDSDVPISARLTGNFDGAGSFRNLSGQGRVSLIDTRWRSADLGQISADLTVAGREASLEFDAPELALKGNGTVSVDAGGPLSVRGEWMPRDVAAIAHRLAVAVPFSSGGSAAVRIELSGTRDRLAALRGRVAVDALDIRIGDQPIRLARAGQLEYDGRAIRVDNVVLSSGASTLTIDGSLGEPVARGFTVALDGSLSDIAFVRDFIQPRAIDAGELPSLVGSVHLRVAAEGALSQPRISGSLQVAGGRVPLTARQSLSDIGVSARYDDGVLTVDSATARFEGATLAASARVPSTVVLDRLPSSIQPLVTPASGAATLSAQILSLTPSIAAPFVSPQTLDQVAGRADATIQLEADRPALDQVRGTIALNRAELSLAGVSLNQRETTRLIVSGGRVAVDTWDWGGDDNRVTLGGSATLSDNSALDLVATAALDLKLLNILTPAARVLGRADAEVRLGGTARSPTLDGRVTVSNGEARLANPRVVISDVTGAIRLAADRLTVDRLSGTINGGDAELAGSIRHRWLTPLDGEVTLRTRGAAIDLAGVRAEAHANVALTVEPRGPVIGGTVTLVRSTFQAPLSLTGGLLRALQVSSTTTPSPASSFARIGLDVRIVTQTDLLIDNNYAQLAASGDLRLVGTVSRPSLIGRATLGEGGLIFFGANRYRLADQGSIDFANPNIIEPDLNLSAVTRVQGTDITLALKGTPTTLQTTLTSDDPALSQSDLVSLLVVGRTASDAAAGGFTPGSEELLGYLSGELLGTAGRAIGLDTVRVERGTPDIRFDAGLVAAETDPGARLTFGRSVGRKAEVVFSQSLEQSGGLTWIVSYAPRSGINLRAVNLDHGDRLYDFRHDVTFGGSSVPRRTVTAPILRVSNVSIDGAGSDETVLRSRLKLEPGDRFSFFDWQDDRERMEAFYRERKHLEARIATRRVAESAEPTRLRLVYEVRPGPRTALVVDGHSFRQSALRRMERAWTRAVVDDFLTEEVAGIARAELADAGYVLASVVATIERPGDEKRLHLTIDPGRRAGSRRVEFSGNRHERSERLLAVLSERELARAVWLDPDRVRDALMAFYRANGYLNATVRVDPVSVVGDTATRPVHVNEGDAFRLRNVRIEGVRALSADEARRIISLSAGDTFTESGMEHAHLALDESYRARGFNTVSIIHQTETVTSGPEVDVVDVTIRVDEGRRQRLRDIVTIGVNRTRPTLVSRALKLDVGEPVDLAAWNIARKRLYETGAFRSVDIQREVITPAETEPAAGSEPPEEPIRAKVTVQEWPPLRVRYGLEVNDELRSAGDSARSLAPETEVQGRTLGIGVTGDVGARNLFGRAISAGLAARFTRDFRAARAYGTTPSFFGLPITSNVFVERSREEQGATPRSRLAVFGVDKTDLTIEQRLRPFERTEIGYRYALERNHTYALNPDPTDPLPFDIVVMVARLASTVVVDTRDDLIDTTRGWFHSSNLEYASAAVGSDLRFVKYLFQQRYFRSRGPFVFATSARLGLATGFGQSLIPGERFFAGGGNSVRGYAEDVLSPRDDFGDTVGGNALVVLNQEMRFPILRMVRGVAFVDAGRAFAQVRNVSLRDLSASTGFGLRVQTPIVLLRIDFGVPFDAAVGPRRGRWFFSVGQTF